MQNRKLAQEILSRVAREQKIRKAKVAGKAKRAQYKEIDRKNVLWFKTVLKQEDWPTISLVGKKAAEGAWMIAQHADHDRKFQKEALHMMKALYKRFPKEIDKSRIAYLTDRILLHEERRTLYGTQFITKGTHAVPYPIKHPKTVNISRKQWGIHSTVEQKRKAIERELKKLGAR